jgi:hypothetical protein
VLAVADILAELNLHMVPQQFALRELLPENDTEASLLNLLGATGEPRHIDDLCRESGRPIADVSASLIMIELK